MSSANDLPPGVVLPPPFIGIRGECPPCGDNKHWFPTDDPSGLCECGARGFQDYDRVLGVIEKGCRCHGCGERYRVDVLVTDALWSKIARPHEELLCGVCIIRRTEAFEEFGAFTLTEVP